MKNYIFRITSIKFQILGSIIYNENFALKYPLDTDTQESDIIIFFFLC